MSVAYNNQATGELHTSAHGRRAKCVSSTCYAQQWWKTGGRVHRQDFDKVRRIPGTSAGDSDGSGGLCVDWISSEVNDMDWQDRISVDPKVLVGKPVVKGTRIAVEFVVDLLGRGWTTEQIVREYDHLTPEDIQACLAYASEILKSERVYLVPM